MIMNTTDLSSLCSNLGLTLHSVSRGLKKTDGWEYNAFKVTVYRGELQVYEGPYRMGTAYTGDPELVDVMDSLILDGSAFFDGMSFHDWCQEYGLSNDSIKARNTWDACRRIGRSLSKAFSAEELEALRNTAPDC